MKLSISQIEALQSVARTSAEEKNIIQTCELALEVKELEELILTTQDTKYLPNSALIMLKRKKATLARLTKEHSKMIFNKTTKE